VVLNGGFVLKSLNFTDKVLLNVRQKEVSTLVITTIVLVVVGVFALVVLSFK
jgi:hypothetical protein